MRGPLYELFRFCMDVVDEVCSRPDLAETAQYHEAWSKVRTTVPEDFPDSTIKAALDFYFEKKRMR